MKLRSPNKGSPEAISVIGPRANCGLSTLTLPDSAKLQALEVQASPFPPHRHCYATTVSALDPRFIRVEAR